MKILPAIDLKDGRCVRLTQGDYQQVQQVANDAVQTARFFLAQGATMIHMVDLDGAKDGVRQNSALVRRVLEETSAQVEFGGGVRSMEDVRSLLSLGIQRVVLGSAAVEQPQLVQQAVAQFGERIAVGVDARKGTVRTKGWLCDTRRDFLSFAQQMEEWGVQTLIFTDIDTDGMLSGPNVSALEALRKAVSCCVVASGGISTLDDIDQLKRIGIDEAIVGKAIYAGKLDLKQAIERGRADAC